MELEIYRDENGNEPFLEWISAIKDKATAARIRSRLRRIEESGNLGDHRSVETVYLNSDFSSEQGTEFTLEK